MMEINKTRYLKLKIKAIKLRKKGLSYGEIRKDINVPKSTLSLWLKNVPLNSKQRKHLYTKKVWALERGPRSQKERRVQEITKIIEEAEKEIQLPLSLQTYRLLGSALYWAEGKKTKHFAVTNSDPYFIIFMVKWFEKIFEVPSSQLKARLNIYSQQNESEIKRFWSQLTGIPLENFGKSYIKQPSKNYKKNNLYFGTMEVRVPKGTDMRHQVFGWIKATLKDLAPEAEFVQKEWRSLKEVPRPVNLSETIEV